MSCLNASEILKNLYRNKARFNRGPKNKSDCFIFGGTRGTKMVQFIITQQIQNRMYFTPLSVPGVGQFLTRVSVSLIQDWI
jgi:hypothetical protein